MPLPQRQQPEPNVPPPGKRPALVPEPERPGRGRKWWPVAIVLLVAAGGLLWQTKLETGFDGGGGGAGLTVAPAVPADRGRIDRTLRLTGTTAAEKFVSLTSPRMRGSRSRRGATAQGGTVGIKSGITVSSSSSVALQSTMSSLSQTGLVASSSGAAQAGGGTAGRSRSSVSSSRFGSASAGSASGAGNVQTTGAAAVTAMGATGLGSTSAYLTGGSSGPPSSGGRRRGDFHLSLQKIAPAGTLVKKGEVIAEFDRQYMQTRLDDYEASVAQQESDYRKSEAEVEVTRDAHNHSIEQARAGLEKSQLDMKAAPVLSAIQAERTRLALEEAQAQYRQVEAEVPYQRVSEQAQLKQAQLEVKEAEIELRRTRNNVDKLLIKAPIDGMVVLLNVYRSGGMGQVKEGDELHSGQPFIQIVDTRSMVINAKVNQVDVEKLRIGQRAKVTFDAFPGLELPARVYSIGTVAKSRQFRRDYVTEIPVKLKLERTEKRVIPDLSVAADVILEEESGATRVPVSAVHTDAGTGRSYVYVKNGKRFERREVELGMRNNLWVAVRSGIQPGEEVATEVPVAEEPAK